MSRVGFEASEAASTRGVVGSGDGGSEIDADDRTDISKL